MITTPWKKSSRSGGAGVECVEVRLHDGAAEVRDSKLIKSPILAIGDLQALTSFVKSGDADRIRSAV